MSYRSLSLFFVIGIFFMSLLGCREEHRYEYKSSEIDIFDGRLTVVAIGSYGENYEKDGKAMLDWGFPYSLQFTYVVPLDEPIIGLEIDDIRLIGGETGDEHVLPSLTNNDVRNYSQERLVRVSAGPLTSDEYKYQNYTLEASVIVEMVDGEFKRSEISILLETDYKKGKRSDWFDEKTGV